MSENFLLFLRRGTREAEWTGYFATERPRGLVMLCFDDGLAVKLNLGWADSGRQTGEYNYDVNSLQIRTSTTTVLPSNIACTGGVFKLCSLALF